MTPYEFRILLEIYVSPDWYAKLSNISDTDIWRETIEKFEHLELLEDGQGTDKLKIYVATILNMKLPVKKWVME